MTLAEIKQAIADGQKVYWSNKAYEVIKDKIGQYLIKCNLNNHYIGLTWQDGETMNGKEEEFFIEEESRTETYKGWTLETIVEDDGEQSTFLSKGDWMRGFTSHLEKITSSQKAKNWIDTL